jgi:fatty acid desaturase
MAGRNAYGPLEATLADSAGVSFRELRSALTPNYARAWFQIGCGHLGLWIILVAAAQAQSVAAQLLAALFGALGVGYVMAYVQLFFHEAAHFLLAKDRTKNDLLANLAIGLWIGQDIRKYRPIHFAHHRDLGTAEDTERTYFEALTPQLILESLTGVRVIKVLLLRRRALRQGAGSSAAKPEPRGSRWPLLAGLAVHGFLGLGLLWLGAYGALIAWVAGIGTVYPFLTSLRQLLEHRAIAAAGSAPVPYAAAHRLFGDGLFASTFGGAGFNRHLLHHMEPQISCTRLAELEQFLTRTSRASWLDEHRTSYGRVFRALIGRSQR